MTNVKHKSRRPLSILLTLAMVFSLITVMPLTASAAPASIDVGSLGATNVSSPAGDDAWSYVASTSTLTLSAAGGDYILTGTNTLLRIEINALDASITLNNINVNYTQVPTYYPTFYVLTDCVVTLPVGTTNILTNDHRSAFVLDTGVTCTIKGAGSLTATAGTAGYVNRISEGAVLNVQDTAKLTFKKTLDSALSTQEGSVINVGVDATLEIIGGSKGLEISGDFSLCSDGETTISGDYMGLLANSYVAAFSGSGRISLIGGTGLGGIIIYVTPRSVLIGDAVTLEMTNRTTGSETRSFQKASLAATHVWKLTDATFANGTTETDDTIDVTVASGVTGIVERVAAFIATLSVGLTASDGKVALATQTAEAGHAYYYTSSAATVAAPSFGDAISGIIGATAYTSATDISGANGTAIFVQVYKVETATNTIVGYGEASATPTDVLDTVIDLAAIPGVTAPVRNATPVTTIDAAQYTGAVTWSPAATSFAASTVYTATVTLTAKPGYTLTGVGADFFTVAGTSSLATNSANSGVVTAVFPATGAASIGGGGGGGSATNPSGSFSGGNAYTQGGITGLVYTVNKDFSQFDYVSVDNSRLTRDRDYTATDGSTKITLLPAFLDTLEAGSHTITVSFKDNTRATATFTVAAKEDQPDEQAQAPVREESQEAVNTGAGEGSLFSDVNAGDWFDAAVQWVYDNGLMNGTSATEFSPNANLTRGMVVTVLYRVANSPGVDGLANPFGDVASGQWYADAVIWAAANGIVTGVTVTAFEPETDVTREQMATIFYRYAVFTGSEPVNGSAADLGFADAGQIATWAVDGAVFCSANGIITGKPGALFDPQGNATRAEFATMLMRYLGA